MSGRHKKKARISLTPLGYVALLIVIALVITVGFIACNSKPDNKASSDNNPSVSDEPKDMVAPVIEELTDISVYTDTTISYRKYIEFSDDTDTDPTLEIDSSGVDIKTPGSYEVVFTVTDAAGNKTESKAKVTVNKKPKDYVEPEVIYAAGDKKLATLVNDNMSLRDKAKAIYNWAKWNIPYESTSDKSDYMMEAYRVLQGRGTDCFGYFAVTKLMFERLGIPNIDVEKVKNYEGDSRHYWSLISLDDGKTYYHFAATPRRAGGQFFMLTDAEMDEYSRNNKNCFNRDKSLYPATPEVPYDKK